MIVLFAMAIAFIAGLISGAFFGAGRIVHIILIAASVCVAIFVAQPPPVAEIVSSLDSFIWFLLNYGVYVALIWMAAVVATYLSSALVKKFRR